MAVMLEAVRAALSLSVFAERDLFKLAHLVIASAARQSIVLSGG
jgi:hypothetical protein